MAKKNWKNLKECSISRKSFSVFLRLFMDYRGAKNFVYIPILVASKRHLYNSNEIILKMEFRFLHPVWNSLLKLSKTTVYRKAIVFIMRIISFIYWYKRYQQIYWFVELACQVNISILTWSALVGHFNVFSGTWARITAKSPRVDMKPALSLFLASLHNGLQQWILGIVS